MSRWLLGPTFAGAAGLLLGAIPTAVAGVGAPACTGDPSVSQRIEFDTAGGQTGFGFYSAPASEPAGIVVLAHGYGETAERVRPFLPRLATEWGVIAIAPEYRGTVPPGPGELFSRGFPVTAGAEDTNAVTRLFADACPTARPVVAVGLSMGVTVTGVAIAAHPTTMDGSPLYDYWVPIAGLTDVAQQYYWSSGNEPALSDVRAETGGTPSEVPDAYTRRSPVHRVSDLATAGLDGVIAAHSIMDGLSTSDQGFRLGFGLFTAGVPIEGYGVLTHVPDSPQEEITLDGIYLGLLIPGYDSPFAGHVSYTTSGLALQRLGAVLQGDAIRPGLVIVDGATGLRIPLQAPSLPVQAVLGQLGL